MGLFSNTKKDSLALGKTPSHGNPKSTSDLNTELNNVARNTDDTAKARALVAAGADLSSTNGPDWRHTPLHQASYHGRYEMAKTLVELGAKLDLHSNPCGRGATGTPLELARGGGHHKIAAMSRRPPRARRRWSSPSRRLAARAPGASTRTSTCASRATPRSSATGRRPTRSRASRRSSSRRATPPCASARSVTPRSRTSHTS